MIDQWELLLHHTYTGTPGVIFDQSPGGGSHGVAVNLSAGDFLPDGASSGSGAIAFKSGSMVSVLPTEPWMGLSAVRCEIICSRDVARGGTLIDAGSFSFQVADDGGPDLSYGFAGGGEGGNEGPHGGAPAVPLNTWVTVRFTYNDVTGSVLSVDGAAVSVSPPDPFLKPIASTRQVAIGNAANGGLAWNGRIDDVKVWRLNPHWVDGGFVNRPIDPGLPNCWGGWSKALGGALRNDLECAARVRGLIYALVASLVRRAAASSANGTWQAAVADYRRRWPNGDLDGIASTFAGVISAMGGDLQLKTDPAFAALANDPCFRRIVGQLPSLDCDPQFTDLLRKLAQQIEVSP